MLAIIGLGVARQNKTDKKKNHGLLKTYQNSRSCNRQL